MKKFKNKEYKKHSVQKIEIINKLSKYEEDEYDHLESEISFKLKNGKEIKYPFSLSHLKKLKRSRYKSMNRRFLTCGCGIPECAGIWKQRFKKIGAYFNYYLELYPESWDKGEFYKLSFTKKMFFAEIDKYLKDLNEIYFLKIKDLNSIEDLLKSKSLEEIEKLNLPRLISEGIATTLCLPLDFDIYEEKYNVSLEVAKQLAIADEYFIFKEYIKNSL